MWEVDLQRSGLLTFEEKYIGPTCSLNAAREYLYSVFLSLKNTGVIHRFLIVKDPGICFTERVTGR